MFSVDSGNYASAAGSFRAPIFYDSNNTGYYLDPNSTTSLRTVGSWRSDSSTWDGEFSGKMQYHGNNWYIQAADLFIYRNSGGSNVFTITQSGVTSASADFRAPIFYDSNNTGYYTDPASTSSLNALSMAGAITTPAGTSIYIGGQNVTTSSRLIINWHTDTDYNYLIGKRAGGWTQPMDITFYTGIRYHAHLAYGGHKFYTTGYDSSMAFSIGDGDSNVRVTNDIRSPLYYDSNNTGYYGDFASTSVFNRIDTVRTNNWLYIDQNYGHCIVGLYNASRYQGVFAMGDSYKLPADGTSTGSLYGMAWSHPNAGGAAGNLTDHGLLIINNGAFKCAISNSIVASGNITAYSDERLKTNWRNMPKDYVNRLAQVKVGIYDRTDQEDVTQVGVSAQSFQKLLPEAIMTAKDDMQTLSVNYGGAALASTVELAKEVVDLRAKVERLEHLISKLIDV
jgi:hypothetical protein